MIYADSSVIVKRYYAPLEFWVSDARLETAARRERLTVVNPEQES